MIYMDFDKLTNNELLKMYSNALDNESRYKTREQALKVLINSLYGA